MMGFPSHVSRKNSCARDSAEGWSRYQHCDAVDLRILRFHSQTSEILPRFDPTLAPLRLYTFNAKIFNE